MGWNSANFSLELHGRTGKIRRDSMGLFPGVANGSKERRTASTAHGVFTEKERNRKKILKKITSN